MKRLVITCALLSLAVVTTGILIYRLRPMTTSDMDYIAVIQDKHARLERIPSPRIIIAGGSNVAFGIDSERLESELGMPVVNMGIHAGLGLTFMLNELAAYVRHGDLVVLSPEYYIKDAEEDLREQAIAFYPPAEAYQPVALFTREQYALSRFVLHIQGTIFGKKEQQEMSYLYKRESFNDRGDFTAHLNLAQAASFRDNYVIKKENYSDYIEQMNRFNHLAEERGARVLFFYPSYARGAFNKNIEAIMFYQQQITKRLEIKVMNRPETFAYPNDYFFDTVYHLGTRGRAGRTSVMIGALKKELAKE